jgi:hypothetical protein
MKRALILLLLLFLSLPSFQAMHSVDFDSCHTDLNDLRRRSSDASTKAEEADDAERKLKDCRSDDAVGAGLGGSGSLRRSLTVRGAVAEGGICAGSFRSISRLAALGMS